MLTAAKRDSSGSFLRPPQLPPVDPSARRAPWTAGSANVCDGIDRPIATALRARQHRAGREYSTAGGVPLQPGLELRRTVPKYPNPHPLVP